MRRHPFPLLFLLLFLARSVVGADFAQATGAREWSFPRDHGSHPPFQTEWWYFTGNVAAENGDRFGFLFVVFRRALAAEPAGRESAWATRDLYLAHVAVTDASRDRFYYEEAARRPLLDMAGASTTTLDVRTAGWSARLEDGVIRLRADAGKFGYDLSLRPAKPPVLNGPGGRDSKGPEPGQASYYYSITRMETGGTLMVDGKPRPVRGTAWMDHEFGSSQLGPDQVGWDWFSLQLSDGSEVMLYSMRTRGGGVDPSSGGTFVHPDARTEWFGRDDASVTATATWKSPRSGGTYPSAWRIEIPSRRLSLRVEPLVRDQELSTGATTGVTYWEGAVRVTGEREGRRVEGSGFVELTGYVDSLSGRI